MRLDRLATTSLLVGCGLLLLSCSGLPGDDVAEHFVRQIAEGSGQKVAECNVIEVGTYDRVYEYWPVIAKVKMREKDGTIAPCAILYELKIAYDTKEGAWRLKDWDAEVIVAP